MKFRAAVIFSVFIIGALFGYFLSSQNFHSELTGILKELYPIRAADEKYKLINPLISYHLPESVIFENFGILENKFNAVIQRFTQKNNLGKVSVYFRDLNSARLVSINSNAVYEPASLLKVPVMIAYFKKSEGDPYLLNKKLLYRASGQLAVPHEEKSVLKDGDYYSVEFLIKEMIMSSDNGALDLLVANIDTKFLYEVFADLGISFPSAGDYTISARNYSLFFRTLYNATYLDKEMSQRALELLSGAEFVEGLVAGIPEDLQVAHKFGIKGVYEGASLVGAELHDCGIIYYPAHPYLLCVFSSGKDLVNLKNFIKEISQIGYGEVSKMYR